MINRRIRWLGFVLVGVLRPAVPAVEQLPGPPGQDARQQPSQRSEPARPCTAPPGRHLQLRRRRARHSPSPTNDGYGELRVYPPATATLFAGITGYDSVAVENATGLESEYSPVPDPAQLACVHSRPAAHPAQDDRRHHHDGLGRAPRGCRHRPRRPHRGGGRHRPPDRSHPRHVRQPDVRPQSLRRARRCLRSTRATTSS